MEKYNLPIEDKNNIIRVLPGGLSEVNRKRISKFGLFMSLYDFIQDYWVRPRIHKANPRKHWEIMHENISPLKDSAVLDIGCGTGGAIIHFDKSIDYTGLDLSYSMLKQSIKKAKEKGFRRWRLVEGNGEELFFPGEVFDFVLIDTSLHMIPQYQRCIEESARTLKKGGSLFCSCPTLGINKEFDDLWAKIADKRHLHSLKETDLQAVCSHSGLTYERAGTNGGVLYFHAFKAR